METYNKSKSKKISKKKEAEIVADILNVDTTDSKRYIDYQQKDFKQNGQAPRSLSMAHQTNYIPEITNHSDPMIDAIKSGSLTWLDFHDQIAKLSIVDKLYQLEDVPCSHDFEKIEITKMRTFLYNFQKHGFWNIVATCNFMGISIVDVQDWNKKYFSFKSSVQMIMSTRDDYAESLLLKHMSGEGMAAAQCTMFYLRTMAKGRGWGEQLDVNTTKSDRSDLTKEQIDRMAEQQRMRVSQPRNVQINNSVVVNNLNAVPGPGAGVGSIAESGHGLNSVPGGAGVVQQNKLDYNSGRNCLVNLGDGSDGIGNGNSRDVCNVLDELDDSELIDLDGDF